MIEAAQTFTYWFAALWLLAMAGTIIAAIVYAIYSDIKKSGR